MNNMGIKVSVNDLPDRQADLDEGIYILKVEDIMEDTTNDGGAKLTMSHTIPGQTQKINYDNYVIEKADGSPHNFGRRKLKQMVKASQIDVDEITPTVLKNLLVGKYIKANVKMNDRGFPNINFDDIYPLDSDHEALNQEAYEQEISDNKQSPKPTKSPETSEDVKKEAEIDDSDI